MWMQEEQHSIVSLLATADAWERDKTTLHWSSQ